MTQGEGGSDFLRPGEPAFPSRRRKLHGTRGAAISPLTVGIASDTLLDEKKHRANDCPGRKVGAFFYTY